MFGSHQFTWDIFNLVVATSRFGWMRFWRFGIATISFFFCYFSFSTRDICFCDVIFCCEFICDDRVLRSNLSFNSYLTRNVSMSLHLKRPYKRICDDMRKFVTLRYQYATGSWTGSWSGPSRDLVLQFMHVKFIRIFMLLPSHVNLLRLFWTTFHQTYFHNSIKTYFPKSNKKWSIWCKSSLFPNVWTLL